VALLLLGAILYLLGWVKKADGGALAAWVRRSGGILFVFGATLILTRNIGVAIFSSMLAYSAMTKLGWIPGKAKRSAGGAGSGSGANDSGAGGNRAPNAMGVEEAYRVLELKADATRDDVLAAHRNLITRNHPDQGGSNYLAAKVNEAKDVLLKHIRT
jgi:hypothetical protein